MDLLTIITVLIILSAAFSYVNERFIKLPGTIGVVTLSVILSILLLIAGRTNSGIARIFTSLAHSIDFSEVLLKVLLGFLLFASAIQFDYYKLKAQRLPVLLLSTLGVIISAFAFGGLLYGVTRLLHFELPMIYCLIFGALISPTDPIAVGAILKKSKVPPPLQTIISGESLFNDGLGLILFVTFLSVAHQPGQDVPTTSILQLFVTEVLGGIGIGLVFGYIGLRLIKSVVNFLTKFLVSLALVLGISVVTHHFNASIPLASVTAGLIIGNGTDNKSHPGNHFLTQAWQLLDEVLNTLLFVMMGLQLVLMPFLNHYWLIGFFSILIILLARLISISLPALFLLRRVNFNHLSILTWAGLRGGISIAMAMSLPDSPYRQTILSSCYFIVIFSIIIQGLTLNRVVDKAAKRNTHRKKPLHKA